MKQKDPLNVIVTGVGGQGNVLISQLIGQALVKAGHHVTIGETYGASQRGGAVMSHIRISRQEQYGPFIPEGQADVVLGLEPVETMRVLAQYGQPEVMVIANTRPVHPLAVTTGAAEYPSPEEVESTLKELSSSAWMMRLDALDSDSISQHRHARGLVGRGRCPCALALRHCARACGSRDNLRRRRAASEARPAVQADPIRRDAQPAAAGTGTRGSREPDRSLSDMCPSTR
jgi:indolepyruvate ferredoxin oxidoreductase beta subunit